MLVSMEIRLFHKITSKAHQDPHVGDRGVVWFICVEIEAVPWVSSVPSSSVLRYKKSNCVLSKAKTEASVQSFFFILNLSPLEPVVAAKQSQSLSRQLSLFPAAQVAEVTWLLAMRLLWPHGYRETAHDHMG